MLRVDHERCTSCGYCTGICQFGALSIRGEHLEVDHDRCTSCGSCAEVCPVRALEMV